MEHNEDDQNDLPTVVTLDPLRTVTPLSKYFAISLFMIMPFLGGWVGYTYAPEKVVEIEKTVMKEIAAPHEPIGESVYDWCIGKGGLDRTNPNFNEPLTCILNNKVYEDNCLSNDKYFIVRDSATYAVGNFLVKHKQSPAETFACDYFEEPGDTVIENGGADRMFALEDDFLLLSSATGPGPAGLTVYDLAQEKMIFTDTWMGPASLRGAMLTYWTPTAIPATKANCEQYVQNEEYGLGSAIDEQVTFDLRSYATSSLGEIRCTSRQ